METIIAMAAIMPNLLGTLFLNLWFFSMAAVKPEINPAIDEMMLRDHNEGYFSSHLGISIKKRFTASPAPNNMV